MSVLPCTSSGFILGNFLPLSFPDMYAGQSKQTQDKL